MRTLKVQKKTFIADAMKVLHLLLDPALSSVLTNLTLLSQLLLPFWAVPFTNEITFQIVSLDHKVSSKNLGLFQSEPMGVLGKTAKLRLADNCLG